MASLLSILKVNMITLPNGDKWIIDDEELENHSREDLQEGNLPETPINEFLNNLLHPKEEDCFLPRKLTTEFGGYWDCNFDAIREILSQLAKNKVTTEFLIAYEMPNNEIHVVYRCADSGGYDVTTEVKTFKNREEYHQAVSF